MLKSAFELEMTPNLDVPEYIQYDSFDKEMAIYGSFKTWLDFAMNRNLYRYQDLLGFCPEYSKILIPGFIGNIAMDKYEDLDAIPISLFCYLGKIKISDEVPIFLRGFSVEKLECIKDIMIMFSNDDNLSYLGFILIYEEFIEIINLYIGGLK